MAEDETDNAGRAIERVTIAEAAALALEPLEKSIPSDLLGLLRFSIHLALLPIGGSMPRRGA